MRAAAHPAPLAGDDARLPRRRPPGNKGTRYPAGRVPGLEAPDDLIVLGEQLGDGCPPGGASRRSPRGDDSGDGQHRRPKILQLSGIGPADTLRSVGVDVVVDSPEPLATPQFDVVGFFKTRPELDRPDAQIQIAQLSLMPLEPGKPLRMEREPGMLCFDFILRPDSEGDIQLTSGDPDALLDIDPGYFTTEHDRTTAVDVFRATRRLRATAPLAGRIERETVPGHGVQADQEIIDAGLTMGTPGYHAIGTYAMGPNDDDLVDARLRVRGVRRLRVVDASVLPSWAPATSTDRSRPLRGEQPTSSSRPPDSRSSGRRRAGRRSTTG